MSWWIDREAWRRRAVDRLGWDRVPEGRYLDLCAGTLDLAAELAGRPGFRGGVIGADFVHRMLVLGRHKSPRVRAVTADALTLPFALLFAAIAVACGDDGEAAGGALEPRDPALFGKPGYMFEDPDFEFELTAAVTDWERYRTFERL